MSPRQFRIDSVDAAGRRTGPGTIVMPHDTGDTLAKAMRGAEGLVVGNEILSFREVVRAARAWIENAEQPHFDASEEVLEIVEDYAVLRARILPVSMPLCPH